MAKRKDRLPKAVFVSLWEDPNYAMVASASIGDAFGVASRTGHLASDGSAMIAVYRREQVIRVTRRHDFRPVGKKRPRGDKRN